MRQGKSHRSNGADRQEEETDGISPQEQSQVQRRRNQPIQQQVQHEDQLNPPAQRQPQQRPQGEEQPQPQNPESDASVARMPPRQQREQSNSSTRRSRKRRSSSNSHGQRRRTQHSNSQRSGFPSGGSRRRNDPGAGEQEDNLVEQYRAILDGDNIDAEERNKAQNVFVAAAGNLPMAAQLYWDDYFATQATASEAAAANAPPEPPLQNDATNMDPDSSSSDDDDDDDFSRDGSARRHPHRKIRRSLDGAFRAANRDDASSSNNSNNGVDNSNDAPGDAVVLPPLRNAAGSDDDQPGLQEDRLENNNDNNVGESVSVSDDEAGGNQGVWKLARNRQDSSQRRRGTRDIERRIREAAAAVAKKVAPKTESPPQRRRKLNDANKDRPKFIIPDSDWLQGHEQDGAAICDPLLILWGKGTPGAKNNEDADENEERGQGGQEDEVIQHGEDNVEGDDADPPPGEGNVVADEEMDDDQPEQHAVSTNGQTKNALAGIPHTWLNGSFSLSDCGMGVALKPPKPEDIEFFTWRQQQNQDRRQSNVLPPPYHCKSMTAIFSIVQAMLLTGASIQGDTVNCTKVQTPWSELSKTKREVEFDSRLKDVLAALLYVAAEASLQRKKYAVAKAEEEARDREQDEGGEAVNEAEKLQTKKKIQYMKRRLHLITTCTWEDDPTAGMPQASDGPSHRNVQVATSLTNIQDIELYVSSNLRDFKAPGGVALLMETIARIHGAGVLDHMMKISTSVGVSKGMHTTGCLVSCTCEQRQRKRLEENPIPSISRIDSPKLVDTTPPGHECTSHQLISLLLTGKIESSWKGWSNPGLGFGLLSSNHGQIGFELARPEQAVWMLQGETGYTVLHVTDCKGTDRRTVSKLDTPGAVLEFSHWNSWYGQRKESGLKLITAGAQWNRRAKPMRNQDDVQHRRASGPSRTLRLLREQRDLEESTSAKARQQESYLEANELEISIKPEEVKAAKVHPDDEHHYPGNHKMWRFDMGSLEKENSNNDADEKLPGNNWIPYYRLTPRQKYIADLKLGPKIRGILWTRWPNATINGFTPIDGEQPVV